MIRKRALVIGLGIALFCSVFVPLQVNAEQPYVGGYFLRNVVNSTSVLFRADVQRTGFWDTPPFPDYVGPVISVAGSASGTKPSGVVYQSQLVAWLLLPLPIGQRVAWSPQLWDTNTGDTLKPLVPVDVGGMGYAAYYARMDIMPGEVYFWLYRYENADDLANDTPSDIIYQTYPTNDTHFLVGRGWYSGNVPAYFFQFGVESDTYINASWEVFNGKACYFNATVGKWRYEPGNVCLHNKSLITWNETTGATYYVGLSNYDGVNTNGTSNDTVYWKHTGVNISNNATLWSGSGVVNDTVFTPYAPIITGTVYEADTSTLPGATVVLKLNGSEVARTLSSSSNKGFYAFIVNATGNYTINVTKKGFFSPIQKWANVTTRSSIVTCDFKGMDAPYRTAPSFFYADKCSNLWLYKYLYPPGFGLDATRVSDVLYAWKHPLYDPPDNLEGGAVALANITIVRELPAEAKWGEIFNVTLTFTTPMNDSNSIGIRDIAPEGWRINTSAGWCSPAATEVNIVDNRVEFVWTRNFPENISFSAVYQVTVPDNALLGNNTFSGGLIDHYIRASGPYREPTSGDSEILVWGGVANIVGVTREANSDILPDTTVELYQSGQLTRVAHSNSSGYYMLGVPEFGNYTVKARKEGFKNETYPISISEANTYTANFSGCSGLTPLSCSLGYKSNCVNLWLYPPEPPLQECALNETKVADVKAAWLTSNEQGNMSASPSNVTAVRELPEEVYRGETFNVTVVFSAPEDNFNSIGLTDFAPEGWNVTFNAGWCDPGADGFKVTGNRVEIEWDGAYTNNTNFTAVYQVTVPEDASPGNYSFSDGWLEHYMGGNGPYAASIGGESEVEVPFSAARDMPSWVERGETFNVTITFLAPYDGYGTFELYDVVPDGWNITSKGDWCSPATSFTDVIDNLSEIAWIEECVRGMRFTGVYQVTVPQNASLGNYTFNGSLEYYYLPEPAPEGFVNVTGKSEVTVGEGMALIGGVTRGLNTSLLDNVTVKLWKNSTLVGNTTTDSDGKYVLTVPEFGDYVVNISKKGFTNVPFSENQSISVTERKWYTLNFSGDYGLMPNAPDGFYVIQCSNLWLCGGWYPPEQALSKWSVDHVLWYWTHPQGDPPSERGSNESVSSITVVRDIPSGVKRGETFDVTMTFTTPEDDFNSILLTDFAPEGWDTRVNVSRCSPKAGGANVAGNKVEVVWEKSFPGNTNFTAVYQVTVPEDTSLGNYTFGEGFIAHYINVTGPYIAFVAGESEITVGEGIANVTGAGVYPVEGVGTRQITGTAARSIPTVARDMPSEVGRGETFNITVTFTSPESGFEFLVLTDFAPEGWEPKKEEVWWGAYYGEPQEFSVVYNVTVPVDATAGIHTFGKGDIKYFLAPDEAYRAWIGGASEVTVANRPPIAAIAGSYTGDEESPITLNGVTSYDPDGTIVKYRWDLDGDGEFDDTAGVKLSHPWWWDDYNGTIGLEVTDNDGASSTASTTVTVLNVPPVVDAGPDQEAQCSDPVNFSGSFTDPGRFDTHTILWDFGDGTSLTGELSPTHYYPQPGVYNATLTVTDDNGGVGVDSCTVTIGKEDVMINVAPKEGFFNETVTLEVEVLDGDRHILLDGPYEASFKVGNKEVGTATIEKTGHTEIDWQVSLIPTEPQETYPIKVSFVENPYYLSAEGEATFTLESAEGLKQEALGQLEEIKAEKRASQELIKGAIRSVNHSLDDRLWENASRLNPKMLAGALVFDEEKTAVLNLESAQLLEPKLSAEIEAVISNLTEADRLLAIVALEDAKSIEVGTSTKGKLVDMEIAKAEYELQKADKWLDKDKPALAINSYKLAWMYAQAAIRLAK